MIAVTEKESKIPYICYKFLFTKVECGKSPFSEKQSIFEKVFVSEIISTFSIQWKPATNWEEESRWS